MSETTEKQKVMVIGLSNEDYARELSHQGMDVMVVATMADAFKEAHGNIVYQRGLVSGWRRLIISLPRYAYDRNGRRKSIRKSNTNH